MAVLDSLIKGDGKIVCGKINKIIGGSKTNGC